jgi:hypothetical protein
MGLAHLALLLWISIVVFHLRLWLWVVAPIYFFPAFAFGVFGIASDEEHEKRHVLRMLGVRCSQALNAKWRAELS